MIARRSPVLAFSRCAERICPPWLYAENIHPGNGRMLLSSGPDDV
jgi:hypothetical protein